ncbi:hypothetical protein BD414DRAFT_22909 [Trametes punicea]|nr:hypothetical protein BD414DRAFT_22909 [Trametes punicea]
MRASIAVPPLSAPTVPKPPRGYKGRFARHLRVEDQETFQDAKPLIVDLIHQELNSEQTMSSQEHALSQLIAKTLEVFPAFNAYEDAWPIAFYARRRFEALRSRLQKRKAQHRTQKHVFVAASPSSGSESPVLRPPRMNLPTRMSKTIECVSDRTSKSCRHTAATPNAANVISDSGQLSGDTGISRGIMDQAANADEQDVLNFLLGADKTSAYLLEHFRFAGLTSKARLSTMARWTQADKDEFLVKELQLSAFERKVVNDALTRLRTV